MRSSRTLLIQQPKLIASERDLLFLDSRPGDDGDLSPIARADQGRDHGRHGASALPSACWATLGGVRLLLVRQFLDPFAIAQSEPHIVLIGDDLTEARGPTPFHRPSLIRVFRRANGIVIASPDARAEVYTLTAQPAVLVAAIPTARARSSNATILTETGLDREIALVALVKKHAAGVPLLLSTVKGETA